MRRMAWIPLAVAAVTGCDAGSQSAVDPRHDLQTEITEGRRTALVRAVERVSPSVVGIYAVTQRAAAHSPSLEFFRQFFPQFRISQNQPVPQLGSGISLDSKGYFLTNHHLVGTAEEIWVILSDGRQFPSEVVGTDPNYDLAVIKVREQGEHVFETAPLGDSDSLMVGEWVLAMGNPYGLYIGDPRPSVTAGVVSALHRDIKINEGSAIYKDMIQTDAAINPGNSGGPLVNAVGEVIGINTFILSQGGGSLGIGFAIPIRIAMEVAEELMIYKKVRGRWIGIAVQELNAPWAAQLGVAATKGLVVWSLEKESPAERAGIRLGDVIRSVNGDRVRDTRDAKRAIFAARVGDTLTFGIERSDETVEIPVTLEELPAGSERGTP
jgi:S1-C subfamily serine protease